MNKQQRSTEHELVLTRKEAAEWLRISVSTLDRIPREELPIVKLTERCRGYRMSRLEAFVAHKERE